jgi:hypothetical protein
MKHGCFKTGGADEFCGSGNKRGSRISEINETSGEGQGF